MLKVNIIYLKKFLKFLKLAQIALQIYAAQSYLKSHPEKAADIGLLYVVGEEVDHIGMKAANSLQISPEFIICGEPTENKLAKLQKGILKVKLTTTGVAAHSGYPEKGISSLDTLLDILRVIKETNWPEKADFGKTTVNIGLLTSGAAANIIPAHSEAILMFRLVTPCEQVLQQLIERVGQMGKIEVVSMNDPLELDVLENKELFETATVAFNTDLPYLQCGNAKRFLFGAGSIMDAHGEGEKVRKEELDEGLKGYLTLIEELLGK
jgi:acetylornithine deacetylase